jgi:arginine decarboxylase
MKNKYIDLIEQTFDFPQEEFRLKENNTLLWQGIDLEALIMEHGTPLKISYLPKISENIQLAKSWFQSAINEQNYEGSYNYCYCTKSSHFSHVLKEALKNDIHIETSSAIDINIVKKLKEEGVINNETYVLCNGFKRGQYIENITELINSGHKNCIPIIDNYEEVHLLHSRIKGKLKIGIRICI